MTDEQAFDLLHLQNMKGNYEETLNALSHAVKRFIECRWIEYKPEEFSRDWNNNFGSKVILGIRYDDGSCGTIDGFVMYDMDKGYYLSIAAKDKSYFNDNAVIEKYMKYPTYNE